VRLVAGADPKEIAELYNAEFHGQIGALENTYLFKRPNFKLSPKETDPLAADPRVLWLEQQLSRKQQPRTAPSPPGGGGVDLERG